MIDTKAANHVEMVRGYLKHGRKRDNGRGYILVNAPEHPAKRQNGRVLEHVLVAEAALGRPLPAGAEVHHVNGDKSDNRPSNLVICQDLGYHRLLHQRERAREACGRADYMKCGYCREWDHQNNLYVNRKHGVCHHRACNRASARRSWARRHPRTV